MTWIKNTPLFTYMLIMYNLVVFSGEVFSEEAGNTLSLETEAYAVTLLSGPIFSFNIGELLLMTGVAILYIEIFKATRSSNASIFDHLFSMLVFVAFLLEFLLVPKAATACFFILMLMTFLDVIAGFTVTISTARRDLDLATGR